VFSSGYQSSPDHVLHGSKCFVVWGLGFHSRSEAGILLACFEISSCNRNNVLKAEAVHIYIYISVSFVILSIFCLYSLIMLRVTDRTENGIEMYPCFSRHCSLAFCGVSVAIVHCRHVERKCDLACIRTHSPEGMSLQIVDRNMSCLFRKLFHYRLSK
jgi:hypothetical protein